MSNRTTRRRLSKRESWRRFYADVEEIAELGERGISAAAIGARLGLSENFVVLTLETLEQTLEKEAKKCPK